MGRLIILAEKTVSANIGKEEPVPVADIYAASNLAQPVGLRGAVPGVVEAVVINRLAIATIHGSENRIIRPILVRLAGSE